MIDLINEGAPDVLREAVVACYQEEPTRFGDYALCDPGAFPEPPLNTGITWRVTRSEKEPKNEEECAEAETFQVLADSIRNAVEQRKS